MADGTGRTQPAGAPGVTGTRVRRPWRLPAELETERPDGAVVRRLVLGSALMLFLELALIRWLGANVVHLSYFSNFVLLGSFLGIGLGFLISRRNFSVLPATPVILALLVIATYLEPVTIDRAGDQVIYFTSLSTTGPPAVVALPLIFILVAAVLAGPSEVVGRCFAHLRPLTAYRWDLVGSLIGIASFTLLSFLRAPSVVWGIVVTICFVVLIGGWRRYLAGLAGLAMVGALLMETLAPGVSWSPYYKIHTDDRLVGGTSLTDISVNGVPHQIMRAAQTRLREEPQYGLPYQRAAGNSLDNVLIIGAGSGSDVAIALSKGAKHIDAVDIDPRIMDIGAEKNPDHPYDDPRVTRHVNDGRAFLQTTDQKYDLILFALPDSLALVTGASQIRLESFLFTEQALESARDHLTPDGSFSMYNYYREDWLIDRLAGTAATAFGHTPCVDETGGGEAVVTAALDESKQSCGTPYTPAGPVIAPATDDRPFLYYQGGGIPSMYLWTLAGILAISLIGVRILGGPFRAMRPYADLFFMGAAFLLLETKNIATFALLFGTTWMVNALVFGGVLVIVLAAVETTRRFRTPPLPVVFAGIAVSLAVCYLIQPDWLLTLPFLLRIVAAVLLAFVPIYLANVAFSKRFGASDDSRSAFALNLLGAMLGGCLEYAALLTGYRNLLLVVAVLYLIAFLLTPRRGRALISV
ncbi:MAG TPA: spermidine synthase [Nakamurella sp.]|nr:spermidine synthase [Nakamurella sp.]